MTILNDELAQLQARNTELLAQIAALKAKQGSNGIKVSAKGAVSVYGLQRWPVTLYAEQWHKLFSRKEDIVRFISEHVNELASKDQD